MVCFSRERKLNTVARASQIAIFQRRRTQTRTILLDSLDAPIAGHHTFHHFVACWRCGIQAIRGTRENYLHAGIERFHQQETPAITACPDWRRRAPAAEAWCSSGQPATIYGGGAHKIKKRASGCAAWAAHALSPKCSRNASTCRRYRSKAFARLMQLLLSAQSISHQPGQCSK
ncbi:uncharacterized protein K489DRAFT_162322 [Dissoconium aciculare CBS 342.82]|uniref:Uncharacterized protein n=1 Tax=Dissoconium aciculare CBS 342.82 TaxID=1314786 RepID=A0A6J3MC51_9PEZI|nr:uncharacterized protein K489DRAFT_162322 [Dissoconium aciculare CBS 342.82]KAF1825585.1 hypothetical protein K489DRAFT_162322 [Dissoconium aciculare CBS 342.82]